jgi:osmotically-inducible protein OsmY
MIVLDDHGLRDAVLAELDFDPRVNDERIGVSVKDGVVTMIGSVNSLTEKWAAEDAVRRVKGVAALSEDLQVDLPAVHRRDDADVARACAEALHWDAWLPRTVAVTVQDGYVTLSGLVDWDYQRGEAENTIRRILGVRGINNEVRLRPRIATAQIALEISRAFQRNAQLGANAITVTADRGTVTLRGRVRNWTEWAAATRAAWSAPGVAAVDNELTVSEMEMSA